MRLRVRFAKQGKVRWISHRDLARVWERAFRKAAVPLVYTGGFSPRPRISFGLALPTGHSSVAEYLDVDVDGGTGEEHLAERLAAALPAGIDPMIVAVAPEGASLQDAVSSCTWRIEVDGLDGPHLDEAVASALQAPSLRITRSRKGRDTIDDVRPSILSLAVVRSPEAEQLECELVTHPRGLRPIELLRALEDVARPGPSRRPLDLLGACRTHQWIERNGARFEPEEQTLPLGATSVPHAQARAS